MSFNITEAFVEQFSGNLRFLAQQITSRLRATVTEDTISGDASYMEQVAPTNARKVTARHADSPLMNTLHLRRRITPYDYDWGDLVDRLDKVRLLIDPTSAYAHNGAMAMNRAYDDEIVSSIFGTAYTGHAGNTMIAWPNGNTETTPAQPAGTVIAVDDWTYGNGAGASGLTISKLIAAKVALMAGEGDEDEQCTIVVSAKDIGNLLSTTEVTSSDFNDVKALRNGTINDFMGFTFVRSERLLKNALGQRRIPAYRKSGVGLGIGKDVEGMVSQRADKRFSWYAYCDMAIGATRLEEVKVVEILAQ